MDLLTRADEVFPGAVLSGRRAREVMEKGNGPYIYTGDGRKLIDYWGGAGTALLGFADPSVRAAVAVAEEEGALLAVGVTRREVELGERVVAAIPSAEKVLFCGTGSEATSYALRLASAVTGRDEVALITGCYHGWNDRLWENGVNTPGIPRDVAERSLWHPFNDLDAIRATLKTRRVAAVMLEPFMHNGPGILPEPGYLQGLRDLCDEVETLLIFDEMITFVRHAMGGVQEITGVLPHITTGGKALFAGHGAGLIAASAELMDRFSTHPNGDVPFSGTYNGSSVAMAAGLATLDRLADGSVHRHINALGDQMRAGLRAIVDEAGVEATVTGYGGIYCLWFGPGPLRNQADVNRGNGDLFIRYRKQLAKRGVYEKPDLAGVRAVIGAAHEQKHIDLTLEAARDSLPAALTAKDAR